MFEQERNPESNRYFSGRVCPICTGGHTGRHCRMISRLSPYQMLTLCGSCFEDCIEYSTLKVTVSGHDNGQINI